MLELGKENDLSDWAIAFKQIGLFLDFQTRPLPLQQIDGFVINMIANVNKYMKLMSTLNLNPLVVLIQNERFLLLFLVYRTGATEFPAFNFHKYKQTMSLILDENLKQKI
jgi:hypothetical protein